MAEYWRPSADREHAVQMKTPEKLYRFHVNHLRSVDNALDRVARSARDAVARSERTGIDTFVRLYALLLGAWAECRLAKLLFEPNAFTADDQKLVLISNTHLDRWHKLIEVAFRKHYNIPKA